jgi:hypothetical protein
MWGLSLSIFVAAMSIWFREKKVELPLIAISTALLFALPNVRNSQPGVPSIAGTTADSEYMFGLHFGLSLILTHLCVVVGFFWNLLLVAIRYVKIHKIRG